MKISDFSNESSWTLKTEQLLGGIPRKNKDFYPFSTLVVFFSIFSIFSMRFLFILFLVFIFFSSLQDIEADSQ